VAERSSTVETTTAASGTAEAASPRARNRRTAAGLVVWIVALMLASALVAWLRN
jgi:hypothetical protein